MKWPFVLSTICMHMLLYCFPEVPCISSPNGVFQLKFYFFLMLNYMDRFDIPFWTEWIHCE